VGVLRRAHFLSPSFRAGANMKARGIILLGVSAVLGLVAVAAVKKPTDSGMAHVVVAKVALNFGDHLNPAKLEVVDYPPASVPQGAFSNIQQVIGPDQDRVVLRSIDPNEPVLASKISGLGGRAILSTIIDKDMRAITIRVNDVNGVAGFVQPGDRVDVLLTRNDEHRTDVLLQNTKVLGIDQQADDKTEKPVVAKAVTLEVTTDDGQKLTLAASVGSLSLALRNYASPDTVQTRGVSLSDLGSARPRNAPAATAPEEKHQLQILRGTSGTSYEVEPDGAVRPSKTERPPARPKLVKAG
jgi:pilus assembly protein CpaB